ncbi:phage tail protein [Rhodoplanes sp. TEM]|uniref:Phage tail protein n=1 Tax=Rhodoplanes tepidamans TaxID=200616 RepID=A0ABT5J551_RHOTP|nr:MULTISPECIES: phage tail protein [Rhodoplanes]MDC7784752.1 phage tail protein [Rhodoplanes tepidamans]MDC7982219.1 phage tail protein [Rhodoplanes sp. TEM]MDQ0356225.1 phage protein U [Rhodoplanes tepidamans]
MLYALGPVAFEVLPVNVTEVSRETSASFVEKPVVGRRPPLEFTGDGPENMRLSVKLFPEKFGGLSSLSSFDTMRISGVPWVLARGDGANLGWFVVEKASERSTYLGPNGIGKIVEVDLSLKRADAPSAGGYMSALLSLIG